MCKRKKIFKNGVIEHCDGTKCQTYRCLHNRIQTGQNTWYLLKENGTVAVPLVFIQYKKKPKKSVS